MKLKTLFQDEDFKAGEVVDASLSTSEEGRIEVKVVDKAGNEHSFYYEAIGDFIKYWEDGSADDSSYWYVYADTAVEGRCGDILERRFKAVGNYFETEDETMRAVEKLKAWWRLKDLGQFRWSSVDEVKAACDYRPYVGIEIDFKTLFGGEE